MNTKTAPNTGALRAHELASHFDVAPRTILNWYHDGIIPAAVDIGRVLRFDLEQVCEAISKYSEKGGL